MFSVCCELTMLIINCICSVIVYNVCAHTLLLNSIIHFTFVDEKQDTYQYMDKEFSNIRIVDIAKMAGVSVGTVDRVIHNRGRVSEENRKKVQAISGNGTLPAKSDGTFIGCLQKAISSPCNNSFFCAGGVLGSYFGRYR